MVIRFCEKMEDAGTPVKCSIFHNSQKIFELIPEYSNGHTPCMNFSIHGNHAYFYNGGNQSASQTSVHSVKGGIQDEFTNRRIREPFPTERKPSFEVWRDGDELFRGFEDGFLELYAEFNPEGQKKKQSRLTDNHDDRKVVYFYGLKAVYNPYCDSPIQADVYAMDTYKDLSEYYEEALACQDKLKGTERCFSIERTYGNNPHEVSSLVFRGKDLPRLIFRIVPNTAPMMQHIAKTTKLVVYRGESMGVFGEMMRIAVMKQRFYISDSTKVEILSRQDHSCAKCLEPCDEVEYDHVQAIADGGADDITNLQALCSPCHAEKTRAERLSSFTSACYSELSTDVLEAILEAPKPQQLCFGDGESGCLELDAIRCRRNAIEKTTVELPIACLFDTVQPYDKTQNKTVFILENKSTISFTLTQDLPIAPTSSTGAVIKVHDGTHGKVPNGF